MAVTITTSNTTPDYTANLGGSYLAVLDATGETTYDFTIQGLTIADFTITVDKEDAETNGSIDPGKLLKWLLEQLKKHLCPECD